MAFVIYKTMNIKKYDKAEVLAALYNNAKTQGLGIIHYTPEIMTTEEAQNILDNRQSKYFDYLKGRVMKVNLANDEIDTRLYNRDNGVNAAEEIISKLPIHQQQQTLNN